MSDLVTVRDLHGGSFEIERGELIPRTSCYGIVIVEDKILLSPQFRDNMFDVPGGGRDEGETSEHCVVREVHEETGMDVAVIEKIGEAQSYFYPKHNPKNPKAYDNTLEYFLCRHIGGEFSTDGFDEFEKEYARMAVWFPLDQIDTIQVASTVDFRPFVKRVIGEGR